MAEKLHKVGGVIDLSYQAPNKESGLTGVNAPIAEIYLPNKQKDSNFPDVILTEDMADTGTYVGTFIPDQQGTWRALMHKADGEGQVGQSFSVGAKDIQDIYTDTAKDSTVAKAAGLASVESSINSNVDEAEVNIRGVDADTLKTISDQIDEVDGKVSTAPPMAF